MANTRYVGVKAGGEMVRFDDAKVRLSLRRMAKAVEDLRPYWDRFVHPAFLDAETDWFASSGSGRWKPNEPTYAKWKGGKPVLRLTDLLYDSLTSKGGRHIYNPTSNRAVMGTSVPTGNLHMKERPAIDVNSNVMQEHIRDALIEIGQDLGLKWGG